MRAIRLKVREERQISAGCPYFAQEEEKLPHLKLLFISDDPSTLPGELLPGGELKLSRLTLKLPCRGRSTMGLGNAGRFVSLCTKGACILFLG